MSLPWAFASLEWRLGALVALLAVAVLLGWAFDIAVLKSMAPGVAAMKANTALAFMLCGLALALAAGMPAAPRRQLVALLAGATALLSGLTLAEELFTLDFGIDQLLFLDPVGPTRIARPGRMSPATAFCFLSVSAALVLTALPERFRLQLPLASALSAAVVVIAILFLAGHVSNKLLGFRWGSAITMPYHTTVAFLALGAAVLMRARRLQASRWALARTGSIGFVFGVVMMMFAAELASSFARDMELTTAKVVRSQQLIQQLQEIRTDLRTLESAQRGHLLFADDSFIATREADKASVRARVAGLNALPSEQAHVPQDVERLRAGIEQRLAFGDRLIAVQRAEGVPAALALMATGQDRALSAQITSTIAPMVEARRSRLAADQLQLKAVTASTFLLLPIGSFFGLAVLLAGLFFLERGFGDRLRARRALEHSQAELRVVFDSMSEGIRVLDRDRNLVHQNPAGAGIHGLIVPAQNLEAIMDQIDALTPSGAVLPRDEWPGPRALRGDFVRNLELTFRSKETGRTVVVEVTTAPLPVEPGQAAQVVLTSRDVTERKHAEAANRAAQERLEKIVENLSEGLLICDLQKGLVHWNPAALEMYGLTPASVAGTSREQFQRRFQFSTLAGEVIPFQRWPMARLENGEIVRGLELRMRHLEGSWERIFSYGGAMVHDAAGKPFVFLSVTDVTARKAAEQQLQQLNAELEQRVARRTDELQAKTRELESFCYSVSHDLKAPLRGIDGYSRLLFDEYGDKLDADARMFIGNVRKATTQMNNLIDDLLAYSRQERLTVAPKRIPLREFIDRKIARRAADLAAVTLTVDVPDDLSVRADREGLEMALRNLLDNAIKFSARSLPPTIAVRCARVGERCVISVQDNGTGFDMRFYDKIFEIFQRLHRAEDYAGTGIGLAMVRKAMDRMGGRVWAESMPGAGATFHLELALADELESADTDY